MAKIRAVVGGGSSGSQVYQEFDTSHTSSGNTLQVTCGFQPRHIQITCYISAGSIRGFYYDADTSSNSYWQSIGNATPTEQTFTQSAAGIGSVNSTGFSFKASGGVTGYTHCCILATD